MIPGPMKKRTGRMVVMLKTNSESWSPMSDTSMKVRSGDTGELAFFRWVYGRQLIFLMIMLIATVDTSVTFGQTSQTPAELILWPDGMPAPVVPADPPEKVETGKDGIQRRYNVSIPRMIVHLPPDREKHSKTGVIVIPGGGFSKLADGHEGEEACHWLTQQGIPAFQLIHRTPTHEHAKPNEGPIQDAQKAVAIVRQRAAEFGISPDRVGVLGFSAGGQVALIAATNDKVDPVKAEATSHKPDFMLLIYPYQIYDTATERLRKEVHPDAGLPPTFIAQMGDDKGSLAQGSALLYLELLKRGVPAELHIYERGGHGFGMRARTGATGPTDWPHRASDWLKQHEYSLVQ
jgi:acetyl esterase/lipase